MRFFSIFLYDVAIRIYRVGISVASLWNPKARQWIDGRKNLFGKIQSELKPNPRRAWFHCASVGEFEQGRPVMEAFKKQFPDYSILLTFYSPSGFELRKNYSGADHVFYLPLDTKRNAEQFVALINPAVAVFLKYEFWLHHLLELKKRKIKTLLISSVFRSDQIFFKWYGNIFRDALKSFQKIFVQDNTSLQLLQGIKIETAQVAGDTRFDRVWQIAQQPQRIEAVEKFRDNKKLFIAGSTWKEDENLLSELIRNESDSWKWIIVPHEIDATHIAALQKRFSGASVLFSKFNNTSASSSAVLIVDQIGLLSSLYQYANIAYVGGGFGNGIHNILEAAVFGVPVLFGPRYEKFREANELLEWGSVRSINNPTELKRGFDFFADEQIAADAIVNKNYVVKNCGATKIIIEHLAQLISNSGATPG